MSQSILLFITSFVVSVSLAKAVPLNVLTAYADKFLYRDNRKTVKKEKTYSAHQDLNGQDPFVEILGFKGSEEFQQISLFCRQCSTKVMTKELLQKCQEETATLYKHITGKELTTQWLEQVKEIEKDIITLKAPAEDFKVRLSSGFLKCDGNGGRQIRLDLFAR